MMMVFEEAEWQRNWALKTIGKGIVYSPSRGSRALDHEEYRIPLEIMTVTR
jgi:hypothetical protein